MCDIYCCKGLQYPNTNQIYTLPTQHRSICKVRLSRTRFFRKGRLKPPRYWISCDTCAIQHTASKHQRKLRGVERRSTSVRSPAPSTAVSIRVQNGRAKASRPYSEWTMAECTRDKRSNVCRFNDTRRGISRRRIPNFSFALQAQLL
jgi:hypothetical protein